MTGSESPPAPARGGVTSAERKLTPDLARGFMLLLIAMAYAPAYLPNAATSVNLHPEGGTALDAGVRVLALVFLDNRAFPMFAALFGYGMAMLIARQLAAGTPEPEARRLLRRRSLFLLLFGAVHGILVFPGEILGPYGLAGLLIGWLLFRPERALLKAAAILTPFYVVTIILSGIGMSTGGDEFGSDMAGYTTAADWAERVLFWPLVPVMVAIVFPLLVPILLGAWAGKRKLLDRPEEHRALLGRIAGVGIAVSVIGALPVALIEAGVWAGGDTQTGVLLGVQTITGVFGGIGYAALFGVISARIGERRGPVTRALAAAGQRSLTCYLLQSVLVALVLHHELLGIGDHVHSAGAVLIAFLCWLAGVAFACTLQAAGKRGPADALLRRLVYRR